jgi:hypothetical protein
MSQQWAGHFQTPKPTSTADVIYRQDRARRTFLFALNVNVLN